MVDTMILISVFRVKITRENYQGKLSGKITRELARRNSAHPCLRNFKTTILLVGVLLFSATESIGTKMLASGK